MIILYDHLDPVGAFNKKSPIDVRSAAKILKDSNNCEELMNALKYRTKHLNDADTPSHTKKMFE